jgi:L-amino acid N-acyltransferase
MNTASQPKPAGLAVRPATEADLAAISEIYNHYVQCSTCTYQEEPDTVPERRRWLAVHAQEHPAIVAELGGLVVGWGSLSPYHARSAYRHTVENSVYVHPRQHRRGIGSALLEDLILRARVLGHHAIIAAIDADQAPSVALHAKCGFQRAGYLKQVGFKHGRWLDVIYMELLLGSGANSPTTAN